MTKAKNKEGSEIQITADQILREARDHHHHQEAEIRSPPKQKITDPSELAEYRLLKRKGFEDQIERVPWNTSVWIKYAMWEDSQKEDFARARSVWERALKVHSRNHSLRLKYAEMEMKNKFINHARNVFDQAVTILPRIDQLWYKYIHMEEMLGNVAGARQTFERWMDWKPDHQQAWLSYIKFELRYNEIERARGIFESFVECHPTKVSMWIKYAKFEISNGEVHRARNCYERAVTKIAADDMDDDEEAEQLFIAFAEFEERCKETERARCIYKYALDHTPKGRREEEELYRKFVSFEKQYGNKEGIEDAIVGRRRFQYEEEVRTNPLNYDVWFDYIRMEENVVGNTDRIRQVYERAIANVPPMAVKRYWKRYIYLWICYATYEEIDAEHMDRTREVYRQCLELIPHKKFSFAKIWLLAAQFELRHKNLKAARQILGTAIGMSPKKDKIFKKYIEIELQLGSFHRCRALYEKYLEWAPENCDAWSKYAEFERSLSEMERARAIFELAIAQPSLDIPEQVWKAYIDFEISQGEYERTRELYERLLDRTKQRKRRREIVSVDEEHYDYIFPKKENVIQHCKLFENALMWKKQKHNVWYKYIQMEEEMLDDGDGARKVFERWMRWKPDHQGWLSYIEFELRNNEIERARGIFKRFVECHPKVGVWIRFAKFEMKNGEVTRARKCYEMAVKKLMTDDEEAEQLLVSFQVFEKLCKEECNESTGSAASVV